jgi:hypothetical protein
MPSMPGMPGMPSMPLRMPSMPNPSLHMADLTWGINDGYGAWMWDSAGRWR